MIAQAAARAGGLSLDTNAKGFFALSNALLDASIATWNTKVLQDTVRPISYIRWLYRGRQIKGWTGPGTKTTTIDGCSWIPYQEANVVTPAVRGVHLGPQRLLRRFPAGLQPGRRQ
jgi:hypothetical protein